MEYVASLTGLRALDLENTNISGEAMKHVSGMKELLWLTIPGRMDDNGMAFIAELPALRGLYIKENRITDAGLACLPKLASLEELELGGGKITDERIGASRPTAESEVPCCSGARASRMMDSGI